VLLACEREGTVGKGWDFIRMAETLEGVQVDG
jgi:hypothetical protein